MNVPSGHSKGHQNSAGKIFQTGEFYSSFGLDPETEKQYFLGLICSRLDKLIQSLAKPLIRPEPDAEEKTVARIHMTESLGKIWGVNYNWERQPPVISHTTCFCCLMSVPEHTLYCGHIICQRCLENYSKLSDDGFYFCLKVCPLCNDTRHPWESKVKPLTAGLRVLSLDG